MADAHEVPWARLAAVAGGVLALTVAARGVRGVAHLALDEAHFRAQDPTSWGKWMR